MQNLLSTLVIFIVLATRALEATQIILPLYSYPTNSEWPGVEAALANYPGVEFILIINPSNGPGTLTSEWEVAISTLKGYSNALVVGYVDTVQTSRSIGDVEGDVSSYASWPADCRPSGIFFDDVTQDDVSYYSTVASFATSQIPGATVLLNPGAPATSGYFEFADQVIIYEDSYGNYESFDTELDVVSSSQLSAIIYSVPTSGNALGTLVSTFVEVGYGSVYLTNSDNSYQSLGSDWDTFCALIGSNNQGPAPTTDSSSDSSSDSTSSSTDPSNAPTTTPSGVSSDSTSTSQPVVDPTPTRHAHVCRRNYPPIL